MTSADLASPSQPRVLRRPDVQGLRAVAILLVVLYHAGSRLPGGFTGVDVFFVISGFVIARVLLTDLQSTGRIDFLRFYGRRVRRILPALAVLVAAVAAVGVLAAPAVGQRTTAITGVWASLFAANAYLVELSTGYFATSTTYDALLHTWTLAVEEQFYLVFPALLLLGWRLRGRTGAVVVVAVVGAGSFALSLALSGSHELWAFYLSPTRAWEFAIGALVALAEGRLRRIPRAAAEVVGICGALAVVEAGRRILDTTDFPGWHALLPVLGAAAVIVAGTGGPTSTSRVLSLRPVTFVGDVSYSWYLWHWPAIVFARACLPDRPGAVTAAAAASLLPAWLSLRYVENPIRFGSEFRGRRTLALAAVCVLAPLAASGGLLGAHALLDRTASVHAWQHARALHADYLNGCDSPTPLGERDLPRCVWRVSKPHGTVVLLGDSNAGHFTEPFERAAGRAGYDAEVATLSGCPFVLLHIDRGARSDACHRFVVESLRALERDPPSLVVFAARVDAYVDSATTNALRDERGGPVVRDPAAKARLWTKALRATVGRLTHARIPVVLVEPVPSLPLPPEGCAVVRVLLGDCGVGVPRAKVERDLAVAVRAERAVAAAERGASRISFAGAICGPATCSSIRDGLLLYRDGDHLSVAGALTLTGRFYDLLVARARPSL